MGASQEINADPSPAIAETLMGGSGIVSGVSGIAQAEPTAALVPCSLVAVTVNVYMAPLVNPSIFTGLPVVFLVLPSYVTV